MAHSLVVEKYAGRMVYPLVGIQGKALAGSGKVVLDLHKCASVVVVIVEGLVSVMKIDIVHIQEAQRASKEYCAMVDEEEFRMKSHEYVMGNNYKLGKFS